MKTRTAWAILNCYWSVSHGIPCTLQRGVSVSGFFVMDFYFLASFWPSVMSKLEVEYFVQMMAQGCCPPPPPARRRGLNPAVTRRWIKVGLRLVHRLRRWINGKPAMIQWLVSAGVGRLICEVSGYARGAAVTDGMWWSVPGTVSAHPAPWPLNPHTRYAGWTLGQRRKMLAQRPASVSCNCRPGLDINPSEHGEFHRLHSNRHYQPQTNY